jgi:uncharacterized tellurite resistance protein B-like protein
MTPLESLHYAICELAYAVARSNGKVQHEEASKFLEIANRELAEESQSFEVAQIIFSMMERDKADLETTYYWAMHELKIYSHYLSHDLKQKFVRVMQEVAKAYLPFTEYEAEIISRFKKDLEPLQGDPVFYGLNVNQVRYKKRHID